MTYQYEDSNTVLDVIAGLVAEDGYFSRARFLTILYAHSKTVRHWCTSIAMPECDIVLDMALLRSGELAVLASRDGKVIDYRIPGGLDNDLNR